jgi:hypothetical protein
MVQPINPNNPPKNVNPTPPVPVDNHTSPKVQNSAFDHVVDQVKAGPLPVQGARVQITAVKPQAAEAQAPPPPPVEDLPQGTRLNTQV